LGRIDEVTRRRPKYFPRNPSGERVSFTGRFLPSSLGRLLSSLACSVASRCRSAAVGMARSRRGRRSQSRTPSPSGVRPPSPLRSVEVGLPGAAEQQMDPFECCSVNPYTCCVFYKSRWWGTTSAARSSRPVSRGSDGSGSPSRRSTACRGGARSGGDSNKPSTDSSFDESPPNNLVRFPCPTPLEFRLDHMKCVRFFFFR
jgi:hypothetical protein